MADPEDFERVGAAEEWISDHGLWQMGTPTAGPKSTHSGAKVLCTG